ncbi:MAG: hypothetical protein LQ340_003446 [Diploschistes diacapsis]|nr:MAG: hypothetical protein LQ340_003446 [Diploschistes diacapsis]
MRTARPLARQESSDAQRLWIRQYLEVDDSYEDDYQRIDSERIPGSCQWISNDVGFSHWKDSPNTRLFWLQAKPGTGKSVTSSFVITHLRQLGLDCAIYFFVYGDRPRLGVGNFLRSIAWQIAVQNNRVFEVLLQICQRETNLSRADYRTVWRKLFIEGIFCINFPNRLYLVVDALDECLGDTELVPLLLKAVDFQALRVLVTTRNDFGYYEVTSRLKIQAHTIPLESTTADIRLFVESKTSSLPDLDQDRHAARESIIDAVVSKSNGCFLWVRLVVNELRRVHTATEVQRVLQEVPTDMDELYMRILRNMSALQYGRELTQALLAWVACSIRPMHTKELQEAIQLDIDDRIGSIE